MTVVLDRSSPESGEHVTRPDGPKRAYKHYVLGVLTLVCTLNYLDRTLITAELNRFFPD